MNTSTETIRSNSTYLLITVAFASLVLLGAGCSTSEGPSKVMFSGKVTFKGEPFSNAAVQFYHPDLGGGIYELDGEGRFRSPFPLTVGNYLVRITSPPPKMRRPGEEAPGANTRRLPNGVKVPSMPAPVAGKDRSKELQKKYLDLSGSGLSATLAVNQSNDFLFEVN
ncbi:hypothetical protein [Blastopirellula retiformator]|nr:hypothetical protein [Blastopirellula retiformator]